MQPLPIGLQDFVQIREDNFLYVDKTAHFVRMYREGRRYFLARPRRFGKSLAISTLQALFQGRADLFTGLAAQDLANVFAKTPLPVLTFDLSNISTRSAQAVERDLLSEIDRRAQKWHIELCGESIEQKLSALIEKIFERDGCLVILIDEYDKPILDHLNNNKVITEIREVLRSFYTTLKSCDQYIKFIFITGTSKFSNTGLLSTLNNLLDISFASKYGELTGFTKNEIKEYFGAWIVASAKRMSIDVQYFLDLIRHYYDGYSFDNKTKVYNPLSIMLCLENADCDSYCYDYESSSFIIQYMRNNNLDNPERYNNIEVDRGFASAHEIENTSLETFMYQTGYLTLKDKKNNSYILTYPNFEVWIAMSNLYLDHVYHIANYHSIGAQIWKLLEKADLENVVIKYNQVLSSISFADFPNRDTAWYRSVFLMLLRGAKIGLYGEVYAKVGQADLVINLRHRVIFLQFVRAEDENDIDNARKIGEKQIEDKNDIKQYEDNSKVITKVVLVINSLLHEIIL